MWTQHRIKTNIMDTKEDILDIYINVIKMVNVFINVQM